MRLKRRTPEKIREIAFWTLKRHATGETCYGFKAADIIDLLIVEDPTLEGVEGGKSPLVEMRKQIENLKL